MDPLKEKEKMTIRLPAHLDYLEDLINSTLSYLRSAGIAGETASEIHLAVDEACTNSIKYAYPEDRRGDIELSCQIDHGLATITIRDWGYPFNPLDMPPPDLNLDIDTRPVGGLGIYLMKKFSDRLEYRREDGSNLLTIIKKLG